MTTRAGSGRRSNLRGYVVSKVGSAGASGYLGRVLRRFLPGSGRSATAEVVRLLWPTGVPQDEINLAPRRCIASRNSTGAEAHAPFCFRGMATNMNFIADMIGPGVVGHWVGPGERDVPDPDEYLKVAARSVKPRNGMLSFRFMEPMRKQCISIR